MYRDKSFAESLLHFSNEDSVRTYLHLWQVSGNIAVSRPSGQCNSEVICLFIVQPRLSLNLYILPLTKGDTTFVSAEKLIQRKCWISEYLCMQIVIKTSMKINPN